MRFPTVFKRYVGSVPTGATVLGGDTLPSGPPNAQTADNCLFSRFSNINGWPVHRIAVTYKGPTGAKVLAAQMYFFEDATQTWYAIGASVNMTAGTVSFFDVIALLDRPHSSSAAGGSPEDSPQSGSAAMLLMVSAAGSDPAGEYDFAMAPDLTTFP
jgi:hypothetical protein